MAKSCAELGHQCCRDAAAALAEVTRIASRPAEQRAKYTSDELDAMVKAGHAMKNASGDPSYPIKDADDLDSAIRAVGRGGADHDAIRRHIIRRAKALGLSSRIPDSWGADGSLAGETAARSPLEVRRMRRSAMLAVPERLSLPFAAGGIEMRAKPNGTGGTAFRFEGYASVFDAPFEMWDQWGEPYTEVVRPGAFTRTLANSADVAFLIGHQDAGILMARTKSGTMTLAQDTRGLHVMVPAMDGSREDVRALASAVDRGDMDEMSCAFITRQQAWDDSFETRAMLEMDLNRGDVSAVVFGASPATAGSMMTALPFEQLTLRRPVAVRAAAERRAQDEIVDMSGAPDYNPVPHAYDPGALTCPSAGCTVDGGAQNSPDAKFCDQCGADMYPASYEGDAVQAVDDSGVIEEGAVGAGIADAELLAHRRRELELLALGA